MQRLKELQNKKIQELQAKVQEPTTSNRELTERFELKEMTAHVSTWQHNKGTIFCLATAWCDEGVNRPGWLAR